MPLNKKVSGGQRKRLNIALELMREPGVLFVDEPTSGLSSFDSERVMALLKNQALTGKLVFTIIHQPSSDILKMFDKLWILDKGGYMIYDGDPVEALVYFKTETSQANAAESECPNCGNIETDNILHIVEVKVIDNAGFAGKERQISPVEWYEKYRKKMMPAIEGTPGKFELPPSNFKVPRKVSQLATFISRNVTRKFADHQYMSINLLEVPLLALILGFLSKYSEDDTYFFGDNKNYPVFLFMAIIVVLFVGLTVSAEEIFRDRKILEREKYLNLSRSSYLLSKINFLFVMSAIQALSFVVVANLLLDVRGMLLQQWLILFSTACFGNLLGLNISAGMRTAVSIYILIPLLLVPMLLLGGAMIKFDDLHKSISRKIYVPVIGDAMVTRWAYEALMVEEFKDNKYERPFFNYEMEKSQYDWYSSFLIPALKTTVEECKSAGHKPEYHEAVNRNLKKLNFHLKELIPISGIQPGTWAEEINYDRFSNSTGDKAIKFLDSLEYIFRIRSRTISNMQDSLMLQVEALLGKDGALKLKEMNYNKSLADIVLNRMNANKIYDSGKKFIQKADPVFMKPGSKYGRAHFYAPYKLVGNMKIDTLPFNVIIIWIMTIALFVTLYFNILKSFIVFLETLKIPIWRKFGRELLQI